MSKPVLTFFNNKGGVGKTSLVYHLAWMLAELGHTVLAADLDPQANLTAAFLEESELEAIWQDTSRNQGATIYRCVAPLARVGDILPPKLQKIQERLWLIPGDLALSVFEDRLSTEWPEALGSTDLYRPFRVLTAFWQVLQQGAEECGADFIFVDVGPSLGAINRSALIATDYIVVPLGADLFSLQGLRNLGPTLRGWREQWQKRLDNWNPPEFALPQGRMLPLGYMVQQHSVRLSRPVAAYDRWISRMPAEYIRSVLGQANANVDSRPE
uniref:ParA family protein n=1 Tax=Armatimonas sp. TaxID=1872638 RepID=UPI0037518CAA